MEQVDRQFEFHRLARSSPQYRWWRPLLTALLGTVFYVVFVLVVLVAVLAFAALSPTGFGPHLEAFTVLDLSDPVMFAFTLVSLILMIPALALAVLITGPRPIGLLSSVAGRIRWRWLAVCAAATLAVFLVSLGISVVIGFLFPDEATAAPAQQDTSTLLVLLALAILAVPFQAAAEEYVFRGFLMQAIGGWLRHPAFAILLPVPLFVLGHAYGPIGQADVAIFAVFAGWISWRTGGLEAAIAVHAINNMTIFVLGAFGLVDVNSTEGSVSGLLVSVATMAVTAAVIVRLANRRGIDRTRTVAAQPPLEPAYAPSYTLPAAGGPAPFGYQRQVPSPRVPSTRDPWAQYAPQQPHQGQPGDYDPGQYDPSRYGTRSAAPSRPPVVQPEMPPGPRLKPARTTPTAPPAASPATYPPPALDTPASPAYPPTSSAPAPAAPAPPAGSTPAGPTPARSATTPEEPARPARHRDDRHPSGPAHPWGPGHPTGPSHPAGPGHPGSGAHAAEPDTDHDEDPRRAS